MFLAVVRPDVTRKEDDSCGTVFQEALTDSHLTANAFGKICALLEVMPPAMFAAEFTNGSTPLQQIAEKAALLDGEVDTMLRACQERWAQLELLVEPRVAFHE